MIKWNEMNGFSRMAAIVLFVGIIPVLTFYIGRQYQEALTANEIFTTLNNNVTTKPLASGVVQTKPDQQWKKYVNHNNKYEVEVPGFWESKSFDNEESFYAHAWEDNDYFGSIFFINVLDEESVKKEGGNLNSLYSQTNTQTQYDAMLKAPVSNGEGLRQYKSANLIVDGIPAVQYIARSLPNDPADRYYIVTTWIRSNNVNYYVAYSNPEGTDLETYKKILATFKLLNN